MLLSKVPFSLILGWHMSLHSEIWSMKIICLYLTVVFFFLSIRKKLISSPWVFLQPLARVVFHLYPVNEIENSFKMKQKILLSYSIKFVFEIPGYERRDCLFLICLSEFVFQINFLN